MIPEAAAPLSLPLTMAVNGQPSWVPGMNANLVRRWLVASVVIASPAVLASAQEGQFGTPSPPASAAPQATNSAPAKPAAAAADQSTAPEGGARNPTQYPAGVGEILKMLQAGVSKDVIKAYIESATVAPRLSATDLVALKEHAVPDELTMALMKRGAELAAQAKPIGPTTEGPATAKVSGTMSLNELAALLRSGQLNSGRLDPESYDYFQFYYLHPRTLAWANAQLYSGYPPFPWYGPSRSFGAFGPGW
jgi:hypothetical protein